MPVDPDLVDLLERTARRDIEAFERLSDDLTKLNRELGRLDERISTIDRKCGALVVEKTTVNSDGETVIEVEAKKMGLGKVGNILAALILLTPLILGLADRL